MRRRTVCAPLHQLECITSATRRTIWDGTQELAEIQAPSDSTTPGLEEADTGWPVQPYHAAAGSYGDPNSFFGRVVYGPSIGVDQPLSVTRYEYHDNPGSNPLTWPTFSLLVFWDYRGAPTYGVFSDGAYAKPYAPGLTSCPALGNTTQQRCVLVQWAFAQSAYDRNRGIAAFPSWHGSLVHSKRDASGLEYKRNRVYDAKTGRFTQEDPTGLAGGLNLYGFANGDPVNFDDPFGDTVTVKSKKNPRDATAIESQMRADKNPDRQEILKKMDQDARLFEVWLASDFGDPSDYQLGLGHGVAYQSNLPASCASLGFRPMPEGVRSGVSSRAAGVALINSANGVDISAARAFHELAHLSGLQGGPCMRVARDPIFSKPAFLPR